MSICDQTRTKKSHYPRLEAKSPLQAWRRSGRGICVFSKVRSVLENSTGLGMVITYKRSVFEYPLSRGCELNILNANLIYCKQTTIFKR